MDTVSRLIKLARAEGSIDLRCLVAGQFALTVPARPGKAAFNLLLEGRCAIEYEGRMIRLCAGDVVLLPRGTAHRVLCDGTEPIKTVEQPGVAFPTLRSPGAQAEIDLFCGHYSLAPVHTLDIGAHKQAPARPGPASHNHIRPKRRRAPEPLYGARWGIAIRRCCGGASATPGTGNRPAGAMCGSACRP